VKEKGEGGGGYAKATEKGAKGAEERKSSFSRVRVEGCGRRGGGGGGGLKSMPPRVFKVNGKR